VPDATFAAIPHFVGRAALRNSFVPEIPRVGILGLGQLSQDSLLFFGGLFDSLIEFVPGGVFYILSSGGEHSGSMFLRRNLCGLRLQHGTNFLRRAGRQRVGCVLGERPGADQKRKEESQAE